MADIDIDGLLTAQAQQEEVKEEDTDVATATAQAVELAPEENLTDVQAARAHTDVTGTFVNPMLGKLSKEQQDKMRAAAPALLKTFLEDENALVDFGSDAVRDVDAVVNHLLAEQAKMDIPEVNDLLKNLNRDLSGFTAKYAADEATLEKKTNKLMEFFNGGKMKLKDFQFDSQNLNKKFEQISAEISTRQEALKRNVITANLLIEKNKESTDALLGVVCLLEAVHELAFKELNEKREQLSKLTEGSPEFVAQTDEVDAYSRTVLSLENQRSDQLNRWFISVSSNTGMRNLAKVSADMRVRLKQLQGTTMSTMKLVVSQLGMLQQAKQGSDAAQSISDASTNAAQMYAKTLGSTLPQIAKASQSPSISAEAIQALAEGVIKSNDGIIEAIAYGRQKKAEVARAIESGAKAINDSNAVRDTNLINEILSVAKANESELKSK
ncbi:putative toxic anion resistance protein [Actinomycetota bacterium]|nr:putative toxic anion resistance protein [Actinomycetota bacterium]